MVLGVNWASPRLGEDSIGVQAVRSESKVPTRTHACTPSGQPSAATSRVVYPCFSMVPEVWAEKPRLFQSWGRKIRCEPRFASLSISSSRSSADRRTVNSAAEYDVSFGCKTGRGSPRAGVDRKANSARVRRVRWAKLVTSKNLNKYSESVSGPKGLSSEAASDSQYAFVILAVRSEV